MEHVIAPLATAEIGATYNQYRGPGGAERLANLGHYLALRERADVLVVGEAGGYQGARWSGIAFTSERDLARYGPPFVATSDRYEGWSEPSGTIVHRVLRELDAELRVVLWNTCPTHPHQPGRPLSNRRPTAAEIAGGLPYLERLIDWLQPGTIVAAGRVSQSVLPAAQPVRHPSHGGAREFAEGLTDALTQG